MSNNAIVNAFHNDIEEYGLPHMATVESYAATWADALEADPDEWEQVDGDVRELIDSAVGQPANRHDIDNFLDRSAATVAEAVVQLREVAKR